MVDGWKQDRGLNKEQQAQIDTFPNMLLSIL